MKKIIPFSKNIVFNTNIEEINSISLPESIIWTESTIYAKNIYIEKIKKFLFFFFIFNYTIHVI